MKKLNAAILTILLLFTFSTVTEASTVDEIKYYVKNYYYGPIPANLDKMTTTKQISDSLDAYSLYMTKDEYEMYQLLIGLGGTSSTGNTQAADVTVKPSISSYMLYGDTGFIQIKSFTENLGTTIEQQWSTLKGKGAKTLIIDLRNNGGGYVESAQKMLGFFDGITSSFYLKTREGEQKVPVIQAKTKFPKNTYLLINRDSASAAEMVAVSAKDQKLATIVGEKSFGKGTVQSFFNLSDSGVMKLTTGEFFGTARTQVNKVGVAPHHIAERNKELQTAHQFIFQKSMKLLKTRQQIDDNKAISINLPYKMNFSGAQPSHTIELTQLGGNQTPITVTQTTYNQITIAPKQALDPKAEYAAVIKPTQKRMHGKRVNGGFFTPITVK